MKKIKLTYIISDIDKAIAFEWLASYIDKNIFELNFILLNPGTTHLEQYLQKNGHNVLTIKCNGKKDWMSAWISLYKILKKTKPDIVHCHLLQATILGLSAAKMAQIPKRMYTRHHSTQHHIYHKKGVYWDKLANKLATHIIAVSPMVMDILSNWESVNKQKIFCIPHGFILENYSVVSEKRIQTIKAKYGLEERKPIVGVISRFIELKGVQYIIPAFKKLLVSHPDALMLLFSPKGDFAEMIEDLLKDIPEKNYLKINFESDIAACFHAMDAFVHVPIDEHSEAFGQIYVEALAAETPSIFTLSGIAPIFVKNRENALVVPFKDSEAIFAALEYILQNKEKSKIMAKKGRADVEAQFSLKNMIDGLQELYLGR